MTLLIQLIYLLNYLLDIFDSWNDSSVTDIMLLIKSTLDNLLIQFIYSLYYLLDFSDSNIPGDDFIE